MPGDEVHEEAGTSAQAAPDAGRGRTGPRHAAPRKPLLTRLHVPAGKAIAIAAMPSAVLMGMGLTPQLANAKPLPKNPFKPGPCVSQPDKDDAEDEKKDEAGKGQDQDGGADAPGGDAGTDEPGSGSGSEKPEPEPSEPPASGGGSGGSGGGSEEPEPSPSPSDPEEGDDEDEDEDDGGFLGGIGDAIGDILSPKEKKEKEKEEAEKEKAEKEAEEKAASPSPSDSGSSSSKSGSKPVEDTVGKVGDGLKDTTDKLGEAAKGAEDGLSGGKAESGKAGADGKKAFPCVEAKKDKGEDEQTPATLPNDPWTLEASSLGLHGLDYKGVVNLRTANGKTKQALKFTAESVDIGDLHQIVEAADGTTYHVRAAKGSTSTIRDGQVTMYTERLKGNLFGLIPITFDPEHPPPLNIPEAYFTNVEVSQAGQFGGNLTVPGLKQSID
ncbi:hypothetical protein H181DRAFT_02889 [Streptomyces sp. WMMB 714]|uniref:hypothetical protein n=1 Tax=Streptomyces sp. WMMB 714 TaxID=1286822 RepID=UPI0005F81087|nr:hypothetical protein [Streptomyces sp. WMMB 714]SCK35168.1 hypothetical protein H181DRAFT_02889 [Streptomyces sp. WMMB 714]